MQTLTQCMTWIACDQGNVEEEVVGRFGQRGLSVLHRELDVKCKLWAILYSETPGIVRKSLLYRVSVYDLSSPSHTKRWMIRRLGLVRDLEMGANIVYWALGCSQVLVENWTRVTSNGCWTFPNGKIGKMRRCWSRWLVSFCWSTVRILILSSTTLDTFHSFNRSFYCFFYSRLLFLSLRKGAMMQSQSNRWQTYLPYETYLDTERPV